jgi:hypothetical protein
MKNPKHSDMKIAVGAGQALPAVACTSSCGDGRPLHLFHTGEEAGYGKPYPYRSIAKALIRTILVRAVSLRSG